MPARYTKEGASRNLHRERRRLRSVRCYEKMLVLIEKPGAERIFPNVEAVKADFTRRLAIARALKAYREGYPGGRVRGGRGRKMT